MREPTRTVQVGAHEIALRESGNGPPLVLLHPLALDGRVWGAFADRLSRHHRVVAVDVRGHGASSWDGEPFTIADLAQDVAGVLDVLSLDSAHVLGMSMGGSIALTLAGLHPERLDRLVLADTTAWYGADAVTTWDERAEKAAGVPRGRQVSFQVDRWFTEAFRRDSPHEVHRVVGIFLETDSRAHATASRAMGRLDSRDLLRAVTAPTLVATGEEDYATPPAMGRAVAEAVADGRFVELASLRHLSFVERPDLAAMVHHHLEDDA